MANIKSALKRMKQDAKKGARNKARKAACATFEKSFEKALEAKEFESAASILKTVISKYDLAAKNGTIKKAKADRKKSRLTVRYNNAVAAK